MRIASRDIQCVEGVFLVYFQKFRSHFRVGKDVYEHDINEYGCSQPSNGLRWLRTPVGYGRESDGHSWGHSFVGWSLVGSLDRRMVTRGVTRSLEGFRRNTY